MNDKKIIESLITDSEINPYKEGLETLGFREEIIENISKIIRDLYQFVENNKNKEINRNPTTMLKGAIFAVGTRKYNNTEWMEHCSSSLREIFHVWKDTKLYGLKGDLEKFFKNKIQNKIINNNEIKKIWNYYEFFSGIDHHEPSKWKGALSAITRNQLKHTDGLSDDEFINEVRNFFLLLQKIIL